MTNETKAERMARRFLWHYDQQAWDGLSSRDQECAAAAMQAALDAEEPGECPPTHVDVPVVVVVSDDGHFIAEQDHKPVAHDSWDRKVREGQRNSMSRRVGGQRQRFSTITIRAPKPAPVADLGVVVAKEEG